MLLTVRGQLTGVDLGSLNYVFDRFTKYPQVKEAFKYTARTCMQQLPTETQNAVVQSLIDQLTSINDD